MPNSQPFCILCSRSTPSTGHTTNSAYRWLNYSGVEYVPQQELEPEQLLNQGGAIPLDGRFAHADVYFDIKSFGFEHKIKEAFRKRLANALGTDVIIDGSMNNAVDDINAVFARVDTIIDDLRKSRADPESRLGH